MHLLATVLIFIRHGESEGNKVSRFNGSLDLPLTDKGREQAVKTAEYLKKYKIDKVYSSNLSRALETARIIADTQGVDVIENEKLREIYGGDFEGETYDDLRIKFPVEFGAWFDDLGNCKCPNGESVRELLHRFNEEVKHIAAENTDRTVLIGTHAMPIRVMSAVWNKKDITQVRDFDFVRNASVTVVDYSDIENPVVLEYDVAEHLGELTTELPKGL